MRLFSFFLVMIAAKHMGPGYQRVWQTAASGKPTGCWLLAALLKNKISVGFRLQTLRLRGTNSAAQSKEHVGMNWAKLPSA